MIRGLLCKTRNVNIEVNMEELSMIEKLNIAKITELYTYFRHESHEREQLRTGPIREFPRGPGANFYLKLFYFFPDKHQSRSPSLRSSGRNMRLWDNPFHGGI